MIALDTTFLIDLYWSDSPRHEKAVYFYNKLENEPDEKSFSMAKAWLSIYSLGRNRLNDTNMAACYAQSGASKIITANPADFNIFQFFTVIDYSS